MGICGRWGIASLLLVLFIATAQAGDKESLRNDALLLMGVSVFPAGTAAYCNKYVEPNDRLIAAAVAWNKRNGAAMKRVVKVFEWTGGMSDADRAALDRYAYQLVKQSVESEPNRAEYCRGIADQLDGGGLDLDKQETTAPALQRIMAAEID